MIRRMMRPVGVTLVLVGALLIAVAADGRSANTLDLRVTLGLVSDPVACPPDLPQDNTECRKRAGQGAVPGLGVVSEAYAWVYRVGPPTCPANLAKPLATKGQLSVAGKGEILFQLADGPRCVDVEPVRNEPQDFTITGGTGSFAGASGSGKVQPAVSGGVGTETWIGTVAVPGLEFDLTPPTLSGATAKTVRVPKGAKTAKVTYKVRASDAVDGPVPTVCRPRSGSRFKIGKTTVRCSATDSSGNTGKASFAVAVRPRR